MSNQNYFGQSVQQPAPQPQSGGAGKVLGILGAIGAAAGIAAVVAGGGRKTAPRSRGGFSGPKKPSKGCGCGR